MPTETDAKEGRQQVSALPCDVIIVEPLARSTGHQSWFATNLAQGIVESGHKPTLITFDGMNDEADLLLRAGGCRVQRVLPIASRWLKWSFGKITGIAPGSIASPSAVRWRFQLYLYNQLATVFSVLYAARSTQSGQRAILHLLCPPSWITLRCFEIARRGQTYLVITTFAPPGSFRGSPELRRRLCCAGVLTIVVQTNSLAAEWIRDVGALAVRMIPLASGDTTLPINSRESRDLLDLPQDKPILAVIGCISPAKGYIELFRALRGSEKNFRVLLIGDTGDWISPDPEEVAREAGWLDHTIIRKEFVPEPLMPHLFSAVSAVALLYRQPNGSSGILSLCRQYRVPVIATRFGDIGAMVRTEELGLTVDPDNPQEVREALGRILDGHALRRTASTQELSAKTGSHSWATAAEAHIRLYSQIEACNSRWEHPDDRHPCTQDGHVNS